MPSHRRLVLGFHIILVHMDDPLIPGLFAGHNPTLGPGPEVFKNTSRLESGRFEMCLECHGSGRNPRESTRWPDPWTALSITRPHCSTAQPTVNGKRYTTRRLSMLWSVGTEQRSPLTGRLLSLPWSIGGTELSSDRPFLDLAAAVTAGFHSCRSRCNGAVVEKKRKGMPAARRLSRFCGALAWTERVN